MENETSRILDEVHETVAGLSAAGAVETVTLREFDTLCLPTVAPDAFGPDAIKSLRTRLGLSQPVFAHYFNVRKSTVAGWEQGTKRPGGVALRLLEIVQRNGLAVFR